MKFLKNLNFDKLKNGLTKTRDKIVNSLTETITGKAVIDDDILDRIEEILITSDIGVDTTLNIIEKARERLKSEKGRDEFNLLDMIKKELEEVVNNGKPFEIDENKKPFVILIIGVNGAGKTTTIGKLANNFRNSGFSVMVAAADTFRAAANEQLEVWANRANVNIVQREQGSDPSSVVFEALTKAITDKTDILLIDTAGRLHNKSNLMEELSKIKRVITKLLPHAPNETFLVIDGNTGQNAITQVEEFSKVTELTGLIVTKLDGTAKGGVIFQISSKNRIPIRYIGVGESIEDLQNFDPHLFVSALFSKN